MAKSKKILSKISKIKLSWKMWLALWIIALALPISLKIFLKPNEAEAGWPPARRAYGSESGIL